MQFQKLLQQTKELRQMMAKATEIAELLHNQLPELEEPAMNAQCSVIRAFLRQTEQQEKILAEMIRTKQVG